MSSEVILQAFADDDSCLSLPQALGLSLVRQRGERSEGQVNDRLSNVHNAARSPRKSGVQKYALSIVRNQHPIRSELSNAFFRDLPRVSPREVQRIDSNPSKTETEAVVRDRANVNPSTSL